MRQMKDSTIDWIGDIPEGWETQRLKNVFYIIGGCAFKDDLQGKEFGKYPFCKASDINGNAKYLDSAKNYVDDEDVVLERFKIIPAGSIIFSKIGEAMKKNHRKINIVPCIVDNNCQALVLKNGDIDYLYYLLSQIDMAWFDNAGTIPCVNNSKLLNFSIPLLNSLLQQKIALFLDDKCAKIDSLIAHEEATIEELKSFKQSIISEAVTKGLDKSVPMKDSGVEWIGRIPENWNVSKIKMLADNEQENSFTDGDWIESPYIQDDGIRYLTSGNIGDGIFKRQGDGFISEETFTVLQCKYAYPDDLIFSRLNEEYGRSCILPNDYEKYVIAVDNVILRTNEDKRYICYVTQCHNYHKAVYFYARGTAMKRISRTNLGNVCIPLPRLQEQRQIVEYLDKKCADIDNLISIKQQKIGELKEYKKSLIYEYVTGKKEVA